MDNCTPPTSQPVALSPEFLLALEEAGMVPDCVRCRRRKGMCRTHGREILPLLDERLLRKLRRLMPKMKREEASSIDAREVTRYMSKSARRNAAMARSIAGAKHRGGRRNVA